MKKILSLFAVAVLLSGCNSGESQSGTLFPFSKLEERGFSVLGDMALKGMTFIPFNADLLEYVFSSPDKVVVKNGKLYVNDWASRKLFVYSVEGTPRFVLNKRGRGTGEYLQISDFDIDDNGDIWVVDSQKDRLMHFSSDGAYICSQELKFEASSVKCLADDRMAFVIAQWDDSRYSRHQVVITDCELNVVGTFAERTQERDTEFELVPCYGLHSAGDMLYFHHPICDDFHCIDTRQMTEEVFHMDFGSRTVPEAARVETESYIDDFTHYTALSAAVYVDNEIVVGGLLDGLRFSSFVIDRKHNVKYLQDRVLDGFVMMGISGGYLLYLIMSEAVTDATVLPADVREHLANDEIVIALLPLATLKKNI